MAGNLVLLAISILVFVYLLISLLMPEKF